MFQLYSKGCEHTLRALVYAGEDAKTQPFTAKALCRKANIPESYTRKILQSLVRGKFLKAVSGPGGGYRLVHAPKDISVLSVVKEVDGQDSFNQCVMGLAHCNDKKPCAMHTTWMKTKTQLLSELDTLTIQDLIVITNNHHSKKEAYESN
ncbi:MAG: Rrf2 family transcriptional regulator [Chlamydiota bacterium]|nr:Rrf2 family transcriptional regulator [Chlamydiota bacterium]